jgi:cytochrome c553
MGTRRLDHPRRLAEGMLHRGSWCVTLVVVVVVGAAFGFPPLRATDFETGAGDVLLRRCLECHGATDPSGGLDLSRVDGLRAGGDSGAVVVPADPAASLLLSRVIAGEMPPPKNGVEQKLPDTEIAALREWIEAGAVWPQDRILDPFERTTTTRGGRDWWAFEPLRTAPPPVVPGISHPIDAFVRDRLARETITPAPEADRRILLRRLSFDLVGLPPTADELDAFAADPAPDAYEKQVDRLLASPHFGERQARHWLDVARFAETNGYERDAEKPHAWPYRDWVVKAFNDDMPFDRFVLEQLAGDELPDRTEATVIATGFLRLGTWDDEPNDAEDYQYDRLEDLVHVTSTAFLGLTVKCARCHDHKFDSITQADYYRFAAAFWPGPVHNGRAKSLGGPSPEQLGFDVLGWTDLGNAAPPLHALKKGDRQRPLAEVKAGAPSFVGSLAGDFPPAPADARTTLRRTHLARWITDPKNPLTPRVIVNRLWQHHFGQGLCKNPDNLGFNGPQPSSRELLDFLSADLVAGGWRLKSLHRAIVTSATYRQASVHPDETRLADRDPGNTLLWRADRRRLDAESLRDAILAVAGDLDTRIGGPSFKAPIDAEALEGLSMKGSAWAPSPPEECRRRSLYLFTKRGLIVPLMTTFDMCDTTVPTGKRDVSVVALQALSLLNNGWVRGEADACAGRVLAAAAAPEARVDDAWRRVLGRLPTASERAAALEHVATQSAGDPARERLAWASLCQVLFNTNEFISID